MRIAPQANVRNARKPCKGKKHGAKALLRAAATVRVRNSAAAHNRPNAGNKRRCRPNVPLEAWAAGHGPVDKGRKR